MTQRVYNGVPAANQAHFAPKPVTGPNGEKYPSRKAAARALGVVPETIWRHEIRYGHLQFIGSGKTPCEWRGKRFESIALAAEAIGVKPSAIRYHLDTHGNLDRAGIKRNFGNKASSRPVTIGPITWPSKNAAAREMGISKFTLYRLLSPEASPQQSQRLMAMVLAVQTKRQSPKAKSRQLEEAF